MAKMLTIGVDVFLHIIELLGEVLDDIVGVEQGHKRPVNNLRGHWRIGADVGQQQRGSEGLILLLDFCPNTIF